MRKPLRPRLRASCANDSGVPATRLKILPNRFTTSHHNSPERPTRFGEEGSMSQDAEVGDFHFHRFTINYEERTQWF
jgi:hypothetical protein